MNCSNLQAALQTNDITESDVKEVINKQLENAPTWKSGEKNVMQMIGLKRPMLIKIWSCIVGIIFYGLILGNHKFFSVRLKRTNI